jgi:hypothetical protein
VRPEGELPAGDRRPTPIILSASDTRLYVPLPAQELQRARRGRIVRGMSRGRGRGRLHRVGKVQISGRAASSLRPLAQAARGVCRGSDSNGAKSNDLPGELLLQTTVFNKQ